MNIRPLTILKLEDIHRIAQMIMTICSRNFLGRWIHPSYKFYFLQSEGSRKSSGKLHGQYRSHTVAFLGKDLESCFWRNTLIRIFMHLKTLHSSNAGGELLKFMRIHTLHRGECATIRLEMESDLLNRIPSTRQYLSGSGVIDFTFGNGLYRTYCSR